LRKQLIMSNAMHEWTEAEKAEVRTSVDKMLSSPVFSASPRQQRFLDYVVTHTLAGNADRLKGYTIGVEVFDRGSDFDPSVDAIVRVDAARLRNKLREYYDGEGSADNVRIDFPKGGYVVEISTQNGHTSPSYTVPIVMPHSIPHLIEDKPSLAVLPFVNIGSDSSQEYFADGITDSLISMLSRLSGLFIISRQSSFVYKSVAKSSEEIAVELGVRYLLEGSVQRAGSQVRVTVQLVDATTGGHVWSDLYDRELKNIFALQDDLTRCIVGALQIRLSGAEAELFGHEGTTSIEAHDALLRGLEQHWKYTQISSEEALGLFAKAVELDPDYAAAHAWLAREMAFQWAMRWNTDQTILDRALAHASRAVERAPRLPYALSALGWVQLWRKNRVESIAACRQAVALDSNNAEAHLFLSLTLSSAGLGEEALYYIEKGKRLAPSPSPFYEFALGQCFYVLKDYDKAVAAYERGCAMSASFIPNHNMLGITYGVLGMEEKMRIKLETVLALVGGNKTRIVIPPWTDPALDARQLALIQRLGWI
jgi:adenylate cyclase